jgi:hypothetical protein
VPLQDTDVVALLDDNAFARPCMKRQRETGKLAIAELSGMRTVMRWHETDSTSGVLEGQWKHIALALLAGKPAIAGFVYHRGSEKSVTPDEAGDLPLFPKGRVGYPSKWDGTWVKACSNAKLSYPFLRLS